MKIAFVINDVSNVGGTERVTTHLASIFAGQGHSVSIISVYQQSADCFFSLSSDVSTLSLFTRPKSLLKHALLIGLALRKASQPFDLVVLSDSQLGILLPICKTFTRPKWWVWEHFNSSIETTFGSRWFGRRFSARLADCIVVLTEQDKANWHHKYSVHTRIESIPNPCALALTSSRDRPSQNTVVSVGRFTDQKGFDLLVRAWLLLPKQLSQVWRLCIVGPEGSARPSIEAMLEQHQISSVSLLPATPNIEEVFDSADIYVMSSRYEGFGLTLIEAMSRGLPSIAFDCPMGPAEILNHGEYGELVSPENIQALAHALANIMGSSETYKTLSIKANDRAKRYTANTVYQQWQQCFLSEGLNTTYGN